MSNQASQPPYKPTIPNMLRHAVTHYGELDFLIRGDERLTFAGLDQQSLKLARGMVAAGITKGTRVGLLAPNGPDFALVFMALARLGAVVIPLSTLYQARELKWVLQHADIDTLVLPPRYLQHDYLARLEEALPEIGAIDKPVTAGSSGLMLTDAPHLRRIFVLADDCPAWANTIPGSLITLAEQHPEITDALVFALEDSVTPADWAFMIYTSGSTADPKGVVHTHGNSMRHSFQMATQYGYPSSADRVLSPRPFFWIAGLSSTMFNALHAGFCILVPDASDADSYLELMHRQQVDYVTGSPPVFSDINRISKERGLELSLLPVVIDYAAVVSEKSAQPHFVNAKLAQRFSVDEAQASAHLMPRIYGMTETTSAYVSVPAYERVPADKQGANGRPVPGAMIKIIDPETGAELAAGETGELAVGGYSLMSGLYKKERHETFLGETFYPSGDLCSVDAEGWVTFVARAGDMLKISGANVAPMEVEMVLNAEPGIRESAVVGLTLDGKFSLVAMVVTLDEAPLDENEIRASLKTKLSSFKVPKRVFALPEGDVPRTGTGKIQKIRLKALLQERIA